MKRKAIIVILLLSYMMITSYAQAPYDYIDLILVTHAYVEYISTDMVSQHMQNNPKVIFASTEQMVSAINVCPDRCVVFNPTEEKTDSQAINDFTIESFYFPPEPNSPMNNIGFVVSLDGQTLFQTSHFGEEIYEGDN